MTEWDEVAERARARRTLGITAAVVVLAGLVLAALVVLLLSDAEEDRVPSSPTSSVE